MDDSGDFQHLTYEVDAHVARITIDRPDRMNALNHHTEHELARAWTRFEADDDAWLAVLTGAGDRAFCAGGDMKAMDEPREEVQGYQEPLSMGGGITGVNGKWIPVTKPVIAAVNGYCFGAGFEMALACDLIVASDNAQFSYPEGRLGLLGGAGPIHRLPRQLPLKVAMSVLLTGRRMSADEAHRYGLVNEVTPDVPSLREATERWVQDLMSCTPLYTRAVKEAVMSRLDHPLDAVMSTRFERIERLATSEDRVEGLTAVRERRQPHWKNR